MPKRSIYNNVTQSINYAVPKVRLVAWFKDLHSLKLLGLCSRANLLLVSGRVFAMFQGYSVHRDAVSLLALRIDTGRRHQIRIHLAAIGCPTYNDALYLGRGP